MWLKNDWHSTNTPMWHSWKCAYSVSLVLLYTLSNVAGVKLLLPAKEWQDMVAKDGNTLLKEEFLPFLKQCTTDTATADMPLCTLYYDMVYNVYQYGAKTAEVTKEILAANEALDKWPEQFCDSFPNETNVLDKLVFTNANGLNKLWTQKKTLCDVQCLNVVVTGLKVKPVCKFIFGGCKWISKQKQVGIPVVGTSIETVGKPDVKPNEQEVVPMKPNSDTAIPIENPNQTPDKGLNQELSPPSPNSVDGKGVNKATKVKPSPPTNVSKKEETQEAQIPPKNIGRVTPTLKKKPTPPINNKPNKVEDPIHGENNEKIKPSIVDPNEIVDQTVNNPDINKEDPNNEEPIENVPIKEDPNKDDPIKDENDNYDPKTDEDGAKQGEENDDDNTGDDTEDDNIPVVNNENEVQNSIKSSNKNVAPLSADLTDFHEDKDSGFFPYFMFLMFVVVTFYVAYHNKSKILALLIEGRRSRSYSSRGGSRRKQHSAEYRKLDSNLEEAIQSDGGHVMSTQIIY